MSQEPWEITVSAGIGAGKELDIEVSEGDTMLDVFQAALTRLGLPTSDMSRYSYLYGETVITAQNMDSIRPNRNVVDAYMNATKNEGGLA